MGNLSMSEILREARTGSPTGRIEKAADCHLCESYQQECNPDEDDTTLPCAGFKPAGGDN